MEFLGILRIEIEEIMQLGSCFEIIFKNVGELLYHAS